MIFPLPYLQKCSPTTNFSSWKVSSTDPRFTDEAIAYCQLTASLLQPSNGLSAEFLRKFFEDVHAKGNEKLIETFTGSLEERKVTTKSADIPINIYTPIDAEKDKLVIYFHGGDWTLGSRSTHQSIVNLAADLTKTIWISVEYRLGPEYRYPIWLDESCDVTRHIIENKEFYGVDQAAKIGVVGDSAGAMISTSICQTVKNIDFQVLIYGLYDFTRTAPSYQHWQNSPQAEFTNSALYFPINETLLRILYRIL
ncbi:unnamed protein product [Rotaria socialis]|uniref:Alpha/beta hydrolase fold-3 domain-containing protein n=1 Tax=Rotaria socialis TaxID=392032 RepID=A0A821P689_9BILA|nr:unnamed protein product [Rotaria socialis]